MRPSRSTTSSRRSRSTRATAEAGRARRTAPARTTIDLLAAPGDRHLDDDRGAAAGVRVDRDEPAGAGGRGGDRIEADAAPGDLRDLASGREPGEEEQAERLVAPERGGAGPFDAPRLDGGLDDCRRLDPGAVVGDRQAHPAAGGHRGDPQCAGARLSQGGTGIRRLDAVVDRVAHEVDQRLLEVPGDAPVEARLAAGELDLDLAAESARQLARVAGERHQQPLQRLDLKREERLLLVLGGALQARLRGVGLDLGAAESERHRRQHLLRLALVQ